MKNAFTVLTHITEFQPSYEGVSEVSERASEWSEQLKRAIEASDRNERYDGSQAYPAAKLW